MKRKILLLAFFVTALFTGLNARTLPVTFYYKHASGTANNVFLAGSMNDYNPSDERYRLTSTLDNTFTLTIDLEPGDYLYKYVVDGNWVTDPYNPMIDSGQYINSAITVSDPMITYLLPAFNESYSTDNLPTIKAIVATSQSTLSRSDFSLTINSLNITGSPVLNYTNNSYIYSYPVSSNELQDGENSCTLNFTVAFITVSKTIRFPFSSSGGGTTTFIVSGSIKDSESVPVAGVVVSNGSLQSTTDSYGFYILKDCNSSMNITPSKAGYTFDPTSIDLTGANADLTNQDFIASIDNGGGGKTTFSVSGYIRDFINKPAPGILVSNGSTQSVTNSTGFYVLTDCDSSMKITPVKPGYKFTPISIDLKDANTDLTNQDFIVSIDNGGGDEVEKIPYTISGKVTACDKAISNAEIESRGKIVYSGQDGLYTLTDTVEKNDMWYSPMNVDVNISKDGIFFNQNQVNITFTGNYDFPETNFSGFNIVDSITGTVTHPSGQPFSNLSLKWEMFQGSSHNLGEELLLDSIIYTDISGNYNAPYYYGQFENGDQFKYKITPLAIGYNYSTNIVLASTQACSIKNNNIVATFDTVPICMVTVSENNNNIVVWEKPETDVITGFNVYRESNVANVYDLLNTVPYNDVAMYVDTLSNPSVKAYRYKLGTIIKYGYETEKSNEHKTIHLTINKGTGNSWNLIWSHYGGLEISTYKLYRGTSKEDMSFLDDIAGNLNSYTDNNSPSENIYYQIEMVLESACNPELAKPLLKSTTSGTSYSSTKSNIVNSSEVTYLNESDLLNSNLLYPNPVENILYLDCSNCNYRFDIYSIQGRLTSSGIYSNSIDVSGLKSGLYYIRLNTKNNWQVYKFMKK